MDDTQYYPFMKTGNQYALLIILVWLFMIRKINIRYQRDPMCISGIQRTMLKSGIHDTQYNLRVLFVIFTQYLCLDHISDLKYCDQIIAIFPYLISEVVEILIYL